MGVFQCRAGVCVCGGGEFKGTVGPQRSCNNKCSHSESCRGIQTVRLQLQEDGEKSKYGADAEKKKKKKQVKANVQSIPSLY